MTPLGLPYADNTGPSYTYKPSGRLLTRTWVRAPAITTTYGYSAAGDPESVNYSDATPDVTMTYDRAGRLKTRADAAGTCTWTYDTVSGQLDAETYAGGALDGLSIDRTFDSLHRLGSTSALSASSVLNQIGYSYDAASRLDTVTSGTNTATYAYVPNSPLVGSVTFKQGGNTRLTTTKIYDKLNRLGSIANTPSVSSVQSVVYSYNSANQRTRATREDNTRWDYGYDALGQVNSAVKKLANGDPIPGFDHGYTYDDIGNRKTATLNSQISNYTSNSLNQYSQKTVPAVMDVFGTATTDATVTVNGQPVTRQDEAWHLGVTAGSNATSGIWKEFTVAGVRAGQGPGGTDAVAVGQRKAWLPKTPEVFSHDADGNLIGDGRWSYTWDGENRLIAMETRADILPPLAQFPLTERRKLEFSYDGTGRRIAKKVSTWNGSGWTLVTSIRFLYDGWNLITEFDAMNSNATVRTYVWGLDLSGFFQGAGGVGGLLFSAIPAPNSQLYAPCYDANGNVIGYVDMATGAKSATYEYTAFGETLIADGPAASANSFRFSTKYADNETALLYYGLRYYSLSIGRWLSRDPIEEEGGANLYGFVSNNGTNAFDPVGLAERSVSFVGKSFINGVGSLGSLGNRRGLPSPASVDTGEGDISGAGQYADERLRLFAHFAGKLDAFNQNPGSDAKDGEYRLYGKVLVTAKCCGSFLLSYSLDTDKEGGREGPGIDGTINLDTSTSRGLHSVTVKWKTWGRPNALAEPGMQWVALRTSVNIWHEGVVEVACSDGEPTFNVVSFRGSRFPSRIAATNSGKLVHASRAIK